MSEYKFIKLILSMSLVMVFLLSACQPSTTPESAATEPPAVVQTQPPELIKLSLRLPWIVNAQFAGYYTALEKGFFQEEGLEVEIRPGGIDKNSITLVAAGEDTFGLHDTGSLLLARAQDIPLVAVATFYQKHPGGVMALADSGITTLEDFKGKTIGFQEGGPWMLTKAMLKANGISLDDVKTVTVQYDISPLLSGQVDLFTVFATNEPLIAKTQGKDTVVFLPADYGVPTASDALFTTEEYLKENPEVVQKMIRAIQRGWDYALKNKKEAVGFLAKYDPQLDQNLELMKLEAEEPFILTPETQAHGIGYMNDERWKTAYDVLRAEGGLEEDIDYTQAFTLEFVGK
jgi:ABC-type nitrate/sulfonate/bicarbonate transport system substrate-binding protein